MERGKEKGDKAQTAVRTYMKLDLGWGGSSQCRVIGRV